MKRIAVTFAFASALFASASFGQGGSGSGPSTPYRPPALKKTGEIFIGAGTSQSNIQECKVEAQRDANKECKSGKAVRVSNWTERGGDYTFPGKCIDHEGSKYCEPDTQVTMYSANAKFRCR